VSRNRGQIFNTTRQQFVLVGNLNNARESAAVVVLPNELT
jgi:hypothetical protein